MVYFRKWNLWILSPPPPPPLPHTEAWRTYTPKPLTVIGVYCTLQLCNISGFEATQSLDSIFLRKSTSIASPLKILGFETIQPLCRFKFVGVKVLALLQVWIFWGLKRYNCFADLDFLHKSTCIASSLKTSGFWSDTIVLLILFPGNRVSVSL